jgi:hypothetical protein
LLVPAIGLCLSGPFPGSFVFGHVLRSAWLEAESGFFGVSGAFASVAGEGSEGESDSGCVVAPFPDVESSFMVSGFCSLVSWFDGLSNMTDTRMSDCCVGGS